ncbi:MAG: GNAT family N-acetyltransferase [Bdellovibrio sp.]
MEIQQERNQYTLEWCSGEKSLSEVLKLRKICFPVLKEVRLSEADLIAKHLIVRNHEGQVCGSYRVTLSTQVENFETEDDFILTDFLKKKGVKAELAWACVHPDFRDGRVIHLLWRGLFNFFIAHEVRYVFGLASIHADGAENILDIVSYLKKLSCTISEVSIQARNGYFSQKALDIVPPAPILKKRILPGLLRAYVMAGALVCLQPVFDPEVNCFDFMTVLDVEAFSDGLVSHFKSKSLDQ